MLYECKSYSVRIMFDDEAMVWTAINDDLGMAVEDKSLTKLTEKIESIVPEMIALNRSDLTDKSYGRIGKMNANGRLILREPTREDSDAFAYMLKTEGDFTRFCGLPLTEDYLGMLDGYLLENGSHGYFSLYLKESNTFIGYVGWHKARYFELEFYVSKSFRNNGYCTEGCKALIDMIFSKGVSLNGEHVQVDELCIETQDYNDETIKVMQKLGFEEKKNGPILLGKLMDTGDGDGGFINLVALYLTKEKWHKGKIGQS